MSDSVEIPPLVAVVGRIPSGIFILSANHEGQETGMLASWVMQAGFDPPMITVAIRHGRYVADWLTAGAPFALNVVAENQKPILSHFGRGFEPGIPAFDGLDIKHDERGVPILLTGTLGHVVCEPRKHMDSAEHHIFLAKVVGGELSEDVPPMLHVRKSGAHY
jgi:flavin reductase (DIM6/NTAB) family NADH-FMN oxidoreductase RutF